MVVHASFTPFHAISRSFTLVSLSFVHPSKIDYQVHQATVSKGSSLHKKDNLAIKFHMFVVLGTRNIHRVFGSKGSRTMAGCQELQPYNCATYSMIALWKF